MSMSGFLQRRWKLLLNVLTIIALIALAYAIRGQFVETFHNLRRVDIVLLLYMVPVEMLNYYAQAKVYQSLFRTFGTQIRYPQLLRLAVELNFVNHLFPSGGVAGISYFGIRLRQLNVGAGRSTLVQTIRFVLLFVSFEPLLLLGAILLALGGHVSHVAVLICLVLTILIVAGSALLVYVIGNVRRVRLAVTLLAAILNWLLKVVRPQGQATLKLTRVHGLLEEYHRDFLVIKANYTQLLWPFWWSLIANLTELVAIYMVYAAFGAYVNPGAIIVAYAVANFAGLISVMPGGAGIYEGLMTVVLLAAGVSPAISLPVTVMYRVLTMSLQLPPGFILYQQALNKRAEGSAA